MIKQYYETLKTIYMTWWIIGILLFIVYSVIIFLVGANNPPANIKRKIVQKAQDALNKIKNS